MSYSNPRPGYTLPVFACASAIATLQALNHPNQSIASVEVDLVEPAETVTIPIEQVAMLPDGSALAITRSDPGDNLDLTRNTPVWALTTLAGAEQAEAIQIDGGEGIGKVEGKSAAIYAYAKQLLQVNLTRWLTPGQKIRVTIILPAGRALALRTSNAAFGVVEGLSLLGTSGISQPLSAPGQLEAFRATLQEKAKTYSALVFCIGENGLDFALKLGINPERRVKTANWLGPLLVEAGLQGVQQILLLGYHGKLLKLAGGIFHTHHHVADGRQEILAALCAQVGLPTVQIQQILDSATAEAALTQLRIWDQQANSDWVDRVYGAIATRLEHRTEAYIYTHSDSHVSVRAILFDRSRKILGKTLNSDTLRPWVC